MCAAGWPLVYWAGPAALISNSVPVLLAIFLGVSFGPQFMVILSPQGWGHTKREKAFFFSGLPGK